MLFEILVFNLLFLKIMEEYFILFNSDWKKLLIIKIIFKHFKKHIMDIIIEIQNIENSSNEYTISFVIFYYNGNLFILDYESY